MPIPQSILIALIALATICTASLFVPLADRWTAIVVEFLAAILWAIVGFSAYDVRMQSLNDPNVATGEPIMPLVFLGFGFGMSVFLYFLADFISGFGSEASAGVDEMLR